MKDAKDCQFKFNKTIYCPNLLRILAKILSTKLAIGSSATFGDVLDKVLQMQILRNEL